MGSPDYSPPSKATMVLRGATGRCAVCAKFRPGRTWTSVSPLCPRCNFPIERKEGHFIGAVGMNTIVTFGVMLISLVIAAILLGPEAKPLTMIMFIAPITLAVSVVFFPISKTLWSAVDLAMVALEPGEVDPRYDPTEEIDRDGPTPR